MPKISTEVTLANITKDVGFIKDEMRNLNDNVKQNFVPLSTYNTLVADFQALKGRVDSFHRGAAYFGGVIGLSLIAAILKLVLR